MTGKTDRTTLGRKADRGSHDREFVYEILDSSRVGHLGYVIDGQPYVIPIAHARMGDQLVFHGSTGARLFLNLGSGTPVCYTVTRFDGLVLSRSAFESSMNYRSAIVLGSCRLIEDEDEKWAALDVLTDHLFPGRRDSLRPMVKKEVAATAVLALPIEEFSAKSRTGGPNDPDDKDFDVWAGTLPINTTFGTPIPAADLKPGLAPPAYLGAWQA